METKGMRFVAASVAAAVLAAAAACDGGPTTPRVPHTVEIVSGDGQTGEVATALAAPVVARVLDFRGRPVRGAMVRFRVVDGFGTVTPDSAPSDAQGLAQTVWTLGMGRFTPHVLEASATGLPGAPAPVDSAHATALPGAPALIEGLGHREGAIRTTHQVHARVVDRYGNVVGGATVQWVVTAGGGTTDVPTSVTDASGYATVRWTFGTVLADQQRLEARIPGVQPGVGTGYTNQPGPSVGLRIAADTIRMTHPDTVEVSAVYVDQYGNQSCFNRCGGATWLTRDASVAEAVFSAPSAPLAWVASRGAGATTLVVQGSGLPDSAVVVVSP